mmetsp:Transcript_76550/g.232062  ORF Transcript_76550/g.232062 Transcript_76550/m.232062 type:complete len:321 (-) Transcript_76550:114-1076(-)
MEEERTATHNTAFELADSLRRQVETSASSVYPLAAMVEVDGGAFLETNFRKIASTILTRYRGISNFDIAPFAVVKTKVPLEGNEAAVGHAMLSDHRRIEATVATIRARKVLLDGPLKLIQGGTAVIARFPVFTALSPPVIPDIRTWWPDWSHFCCNTSMPLPGYGAESFPGPTDLLGRPTYFYGLVEFVSKMDKLVEDLNLPLAESILSFQFRNKNKHPSMDSSVFLHSEDAPPDREFDHPVVIPISIAEINIEWEMLAVPKSGWSGYSPFFIVTMLSVYGGLIASVASFLLMESKALQIFSARELLQQRARQVRHCFLA